VSWISEFSDSFSVVVVFLKMFSSFVFQGKRDLHILTVGILTYTNDQRYQSLHADGSDEWTLRITSPQPRDSGIYEVRLR
jgi:hypothetical protein